MNRIKRALRMVAMRYSGLSEFSDHKITLTYVFPLDLIAYIFRCWCDFSFIRIQNRDGLFLRIGTTDPYVFTQIFLEREYESPLLSVINPSVVIDLGAYTGYSTFYFRKRFPQAIIIAIEANYSNYKILKDTFASDEKVEAIYAAVHNSDGVDLKMSVGKDGLWGSRVIESSALDLLSGSVTVKTISLQSVLNKFGLLHNSDMFLKIDIEGGELEVFDTSLKVWNHFELIAIEMHERIRPGCTVTFSEIAKKYKQVDFRGDVTFFSSPDR